MLEQVTDESECAQFDPTAAEEARTRVQRMDGDMLVRRLEILSRMGR